MFQKLQSKWKVGGWQLFLIFCVFAITGTLTAYISRQITGWLDIDRTSPWFWVLKILVLIFGYQIIILIISFPFGQFSFFWNYEKKILRRFGVSFPGNDSTVSGNTSEVSLTRIAIFASGAGSNAQKIIDRFRNHLYIKVSLVVCNKPGAGVLSIAQKEKIPFIVIDKERFFRSDAYIPVLKEHEIDFIVLAGFLWKIPTELVRAFPNKIVNIHPALLPKYGGKGMYGQFVHEAVINAGDKESGITIHFVDEQYDHGAAIFQAKCLVVDTDTATSLAEKIHVLEHIHFPRVVEEVIEVQRAR